MFLMPLADGDVTQASPQHEGLLAEGIGYVFLDRQARRGKEGDEAGYFFIISVSSMQKNRCLAKSIGDAGWAEFAGSLNIKRVGWDVSRCASIAGIPPASVAAIVDMS